MGIVYGGSCEKFSTQGKLFPYLMIAIILVLTGFFYSSNQKLILPGGPYYYHTLKISHALANDSTFSLYSRDSRIAAIRSTSKKADLDNDSQTEKELSRLKNSAERIEDIRPPDSPIVYSIFSLIPIYNHRTGEFAYQTILLIGFVLATFSLLRFSSFSFFEILAALIFLLSSFAPLVDEIQTGAYFCLEFILVAIFLCSLYSNDKKEVLSAKPYFTNGLLFCINPLYLIAFIISLVPAICINKIRFVVRSFIWFLCGVVATITISLNSVTISSWINYYAALIKYWQHVIYSPSIVGGNYSFFTLVTHHLDFIVGILLVGLSLVIYGRIVFLRYVTAKSESLPRVGILLGKHFIIGVSFILIFNPFVTLSYMLLVLPLFVLNVRENIYSCSKSHLNLTRVVMVFLNILIFSFVGFYLIDITFQNAAPLGNYTTTLLLQVPIISLVMLSLLKAD